MQFFVNMQSSSGNYSMRHRVPTVFKLGGISIIKNCEILAFECFFCLSSIGQLVPKLWSMKVKEFKKVGYISLQFIYIWCVKTLTLQFWENLLKNVVWSNNCNFNAFFLYYCYNTLRIIQHQNFKINRICYVFLCFPHPAIFKQI